MKKHLLMTLAAMMLIVIGIYIVHEPEKPPLPIVPIQDANSSSIKGAQVSKPSTADSKTTVTLKDLGKKFEETLDCDDTKKFEEDMTELSNLLIEYRETLTEEEAIAQIRDLVQDKEEAIEKFQKCAKALLQKNLKSLQAQINEL